METIWLLRKGRGEPTNDGLLEELKILLDGNVKEAERQAALIYIESKEV